MRNLKRVLSLALASVMLIGMMVVGASAVNYDDFSDKDKIVNKEAVSTLVELGVIAGKDDGTYDPEGIITRAEMAKLICVVLNGGKDPSLGNASTNTYTDTVGHWAAPYIEFCTNQGIVAGKGDGTFAPNETVTGSQAAKMLLVALGYQSELAGFTGASWEVATNVAANQKSLYDGLDINPSQGLTRDSAAQMVFNALNADIVFYDYTLTTNNGNISSVTTLIDNGSKGTLLTTKFGAVKVEGVVIGNEVAELGKDAKSMSAGKTKIDITNADEIDIAGIDDNDGNTFSVSTGIEALGRSVTLYVKPYTSNKANTEKATVIGSVILSADDKVVVDTSDDDLIDVADDNDLDIVTSGDDKTVVYNQYGLKGTLATKNDGVVGVERILIDNDGDGDVNIVFYTEYAFGKVTKYSVKDNGAITVTSAGKAKFEKDDSADVVGFEDVAKDDYVVAAYIGSKLYVTKAKSVTGELTAYKNNSDGVATSLSVDDTNYSVSGVTAYVDDDLTIAGEYGLKANLDTEATFYLDKAGNIVVVGDVEGAADDYAILWDYASSYGDYTVKVTLADGTTGVYDLGTKTGSVGKDADNDAMNAAVKQVIFTYTLSSDKVINLYPIDEEKYTVTPFEDKAYEFNKGKTAVKVSTDTTTDNLDNVGYANSTTAFFGIETKDANTHTVKGVDTYVGVSAAPTIKASGNKAIDGIVVTKDSTVKAVVTYDASASANGDFLYIYGIVRNNNTGTIYKAVINGELNTSLQSNANDDLANGVYSYTLDSDGNYDIGSDELTITEGFVDKKTGNSIIVKDQEFILTSSTVVATIDGGDTSVGDSISVDDYVVLVHDEDDDEVSGAFIIVKNAADAASMTESKFKVMDVEDVAIVGNEIRLDLTTNDELCKDDLTVVVSTGASWALTGLNEGKIVDGTKLVITSYDESETTTYTFVNNAE